MFTHTCCACGQGFQSDEFNDMYCVECKEELEKELSPTEEMFRISDKKRWDK